MDQREQLVHSAKVAGRHRRAEDLRPRLGESRRGRRRAGDCEGHPRRGLPDVQPERYARERQEAVEPDSGYAGGNRRGVDARVRDLHRKHDDDVHQRAAQGNRRSQGAGQRDDRHHVHVHGRGAVGRHCGRSVWYGLELRDAGVNTGAVLRHGRAQHHSGLAGRGGSRLFRHCGAFVRARARHRRNAHFASGGNPGGVSAEPMKSVQYEIGFKPTGPRKMPYHIGNGNKPFP